MIDFSPLWETMQEKEATQYQFLKNGINNKTLGTLKKNKNITLVTLEKLCRIFKLHTKRHRTVHSINRQQKSRRLFLYLCAYLFESANWCLSDQPTVGEAKKCPRNRFVPGA